MPLSASNSKNQSVKKKKRDTQTRIPVSETTRVSSTSPLVSKLNSKMSKRLAGSRFRWINEKLYTCTGTEAYKLFSDSPELFTVYHEGFNEQASKWPKNPLDSIIEDIKGVPKSFVVADFGCGDARLSRSVPQVVHSFDLIAANDDVIACDMSKVPLEDSSVDVCVFCLSLMNSNIIDFIMEARRVLKVGGVLKICEIKSRLSSLRDFVSKIKRCSFNLVGKPQSFNKLFVNFSFVLSSKGKLSNDMDITLNPCLYKKR